MFGTSFPITEIIPQRYSCRTYQEQPIASVTRQRLQDVLDTLLIGDRKSVV